MSLATKFYSTEVLSFEREMLHKMIDTLWKNGCMSRDDVYLAMSDLLKKPNVHISDMTTEEMEKVVKAFQPLVARNLKRICFCCKHGYKGALGIYWCEIPGKISMTSEESCHAFATDDI